MESVKKFNPELFRINLGGYQNKKVIWIRFDYDPELVQHIKTYTKARWTPLKKAWRLQDNKCNRKLCGLQLGLVRKQVLTKISDINRSEFQKYQDILVLKGYAKNTIKTYSIEFAQLLYLLKDFPIQKLTPEKLQSYFLYCHQKLKLSENQIHSRMNAIKFYFEKILHRPKMFFDIPRPKKQKKLPKTLNLEEIKKLFKVTTNLKHLMILKLCYGMGLRVSEIVNLKVEDIDSERKMVHI